MRSSRRNPSATTVAIAAVLLAVTLAGCSKVKAHLGMSHRSPAEGTTIIHASGIAFNAIVRGPSEAEAKRTVLFLHGGSYTSRIWDDRGILDAVAAKGYRAIAVDLPGSGGTPSAPQDDSGSTISDGTTLRDLITKIG